MTLPGIDPGTFRLVAQCLNHGSQKENYEEAINAEGNDLFITWNSTLSFIIKITPLNRGIHLRNIKEFTSYITISETHYLLLLLFVKRFIWIPSVHCGQNKFCSVDTGDVISTVLYRISVGQDVPLPMKMFTSQKKGEYVCQLTS